MSKIKAIVNSDKVCFKCLKDFDSSLHKIQIPSMGYGSQFDGWSTKIHLCDSCIKETNQEWWKLKEISEYENHESYEYEDEIFAFIETLPVEGRELFFNRYSSDNYRMEPQDWIDYELDLLSHEKCKEYGRYSPQEKQAYQERFPICKHVSFIKYKDGSKGCHCSFGAFGNKDGTAEGHQTQRHCYKCTFFEIRTGEIMTIDMKQEEIKRIKRQIDGLTKNLEKLTN